MNPIPDIDPPPDNNPEIWQAYYLTAIIIVMIGAFVYQEVQVSRLDSTMSSIQATLVSRNAIFATMEANDAKIIANQEDIRRLLGEHEITAVERTGEMDKQIQHLTDMCSNRR